LNPIKPSSLCLFSLSLLVACGSPPQKKTGDEPSAHKDALALIREEGMERSQVMEYAWHLTDRIGPRLSGSSNIRQAQQWSKQTMDEIGLSDTAIEYWGEHGVRWDLEYLSLHMLEPDYQPLSGFPLAFTRGLDGKIEARAVKVIIRSEEDMEQYRGKLRGTIILTTPPRQLGPRFEAQAIRHAEESLGAFERAGADLNMAKRRQETWMRNPPRGRVPTDQLEAFYRAEGVLAVFQAARGGDGTIFVSGRRDRRLESVQNSMPTIAIAAEHYNRMYRLVDRGVPVTIQAEMRIAIDAEDTSEYNVIGEIKGTDLADELVMIGGHLDSWHSGTGATDNASGSAVALEAMRILKASGLEPRRTIRMALWSNEEGGLRGSRGYVKKTFGNPKEGTTPAWDKFSVYFNTDNGTGQVRGVHLQGNERVAGLFAEWMQPFHEDKMQTISRFSNTSTDHVAFDQAGLPGFQFVQDRIEYRTRTHHTNMDVYDKLIEDDLKLNAVVMASFAYLAAMREDRILRKPAVVESDDQ
jgi:hypothetical protein